MSEADSTTDLVKVNPPDVSQLSQAMSPLVERAKLLVVDSRDTHEMALITARDLKNGARAILDHFEPTRKALDTAKKALLEARDSLKNPVEAAAIVLHGKAFTWEQEKAREARMEQAALEEQARKREEEKQLLDAIQAEEQGNPAEAEAILAEPVATPMITVKPDVAKVEGVAQQERWRAEVTNLFELICHVATHPEFISYLEPAMPALNGQARSLKGNMKIPGVKTVRDVSPRFSR